MNMIEKVLENVSIFQVAEQLGLHPVSKGKNRWSLQEYPDCTITLDYTGKQNFFWHSKECSGSVVDFYMAMTGKDVRSTFYDLERMSYSNQNFRSTPSLDKTTQTQAFRLPAKSQEGNTHVFSYLAKTRGIHMDIVRHLIKEGTIYQDAKKNIVFTGKNPYTGNLEYGNVLKIGEQNIYQDVTQSKKDIGFTFNLYQLKPPKKLIVCQSPIDVMSVASIMMHQNIPLSDYGFLSLGGNDPDTLEYHLKNNPQIESIELCHKNDEAGNRSRVALRERLSNYFFGEIVDRIPKTRDFNEDLLAIQLQQPTQQTVRQTVKPKVSLREKMVQLVQKFFSKKPVKQQVQHLQPPLQSQARPAKVKQKKVSLVQKVKNMLVVKSLRKVKAQSTMEQVQPTIEQAQPTMEQVQPAMEQVQPTMEQAQPTMEQAQPIIEQAQPTMEQAQPTMEQVQPTMEQVQPTMEQVQPTIEQAQPTMEQVQPIPNTIQLQSAVSFRLPDRTLQGDNKMLVHLNKTCGIHQSILNQCIRERNLYQDARGNIVFVGRNSQTNQPEYAGISGIEKNQEYRTVIGSSKEVGFGLNLNQPNTKQLIVCESSMDALSIATILYNQNQPLSNYSFLSVGDLSATALEQQLKNNPQIESVRVCYNAQENSLKFQEQVLQTLKDIKYTGEIMEHPSVYQNFHQDLLQMQQSVPTQTVQEQAIAYAL